MAKSSGMFIMGWIVCSQKICWDPNPQYLCTLFSIKVMADAIS